MADECKLVNKMTDIRRSDDGFDFINEALICERAYSDFFEAPHGAKRERTAFHKYRIVRRGIVQAFEAENQLLSYAAECDLSPLEMLFLYRETGRNILSVTIETPFYIQKTEATDMINSWARIDPLNPGSVIDLVYLDIDISTLEIAPGRYVPSSLSVFTLGPDITTDRRSAAIYAVPLEGNSFKPKFKNMN